MKKITLLLLPAFLIAAQTDIDLKLLQLQQEVQKLQKEVQYHQEDLDERIPIIEENEKKTILDKINFSPEVLLRFDKFDYDNRSIENEPTMIYGNPDYQPDGTYNRRTGYTKDFDIATSIRFRLNMEAEFDDVKFHGRLLYMNSSQPNQRVCILSRDIKPGTVGSAFDVDRAYIDYTPNKNSPYAFTFSFGLLPTTGGTPMQYGQDRKRSSLFPALVFDMDTYGMIGTQKIGDSTFVRLIVAKAYTLRPSFYPYQCNRENIDNTNIVGLYSDTRFNFMGNSLLSYGVNMLNDLKAHPYLGPDISSSDSHTLGTMLTFGLGIDIEKFAGTNSVVFLHTAISNPHGNGQEDDYKIIPPYEPPNYIGYTADGKVGFTEANYATGTMLQENGYAVYIGTRYDITPTVHLGAEYNYGSKYWYSATQGAEDMFNKLATRGNVYEVYTIWDFHKYLNTKISYLNINEDYTGSGWHFGEPAAKDASQQIISFSLEAKF